MTAQLDATRAGERWPRVLEDIRQGGTNQPSRLRKAWCELTGGHQNRLMPASDKHRTFAISLHCVRCGRDTMWFNVPIPKSALSSEYGEGRTT